MKMTAGSECCLLVQAITGDVKGRRCEGQLDELFSKGGSSLFPRLERVVLVVDNLDALAKDAEGLKVRCHVTWYQGKGPLHADCNVQCFVVNLHTLHQPTHDTTACTEHHSLTLK